MNALVVAVLLAVGLFFASYVTRRRFGVLGLALAAGAVLSANWAATLTPFLQRHGVHLIAPPLESLVQLVLILAPPFVLLFSGQTYSKMLPRVVGSLAFSLLAMAFCVDVLSTTLVADTSNVAVFRQLHDNQSLIIVAGIIAALADIILTRKSKSKENKKSTH